MTVRENKVRHWWGVHSWQFVVKYYLSAAIITGVGNICSVVVCFWCIPRETGTTVQVDQKRQADILCAPIREETGALRRARPKGPPVIVMVSLSLGPRCNRVA